MYWRDEKHFDKEAVMTKNDNENFKNSTKFWIYDNEYFDGNYWLLSYHWKL